MANPFSSHKAKRAYYSNLNPPTHRPFRHLARSAAQPDTTDEETGKSGPAEIVGVTPAAGVDERGVGTGDNTGHKVGHTVHQKVHGACRSNEDACYV